MRRCRPLLGTLVEIDIRGGSGSRAGAAIDAAFAAVARVHQLMSFHDAASDLSRLNRASWLGTGETVEIDPHTHAVLTLAMQLHTRSDGLFDCGVAPHLVDWGLLPLPPGAPARGTRFGGMRDIELLDDAQVRVHAPVMIDLGGIAKGYAVDCAVDALAAAGVRSAVVNAGGDLRVLGEIEREIHVRDPRAPGQLRALGRLADGALATSAPYFSARRVGDAERCALVDPRSRTALNRVASYTVIAPRCALADGLTKVVAAAGDAQTAFLDEFGARAVIL